MSCGLSFVFAMFLKLNVAIMDRLFAIVKLYLVYGFIESILLDVYNLYNPEAESFTTCQWLWRLDLQSPGSSSFLNKAFLHRRTFTATA